mmetsp:Transcript_73165/g.214428  ORF Transcript_73165/g.214428 Transcript_73165/m.214428 type:complete len:238 (-) Transcript_73165:969-1682(-)
MPEGAGPALWPPRARGQCGTARGDARQRRGRGLLHAARQARGRRPSGERPAPRPLGAQGHHQAVLRLLHGELLDGAHRRRACAHSPRDLGLPPAAGAPSGCRRFGGPEPPSGPCALVPACRSCALPQGAAAHGRAARDAHAALREVVAEAAPDPAHQGGRPADDCLAPHGRARLLPPRDPRAGSSGLPAAHGGAPCLPLLLLPSLRGARPPGGRLPRRRPSVCCGRLLLRVSPPRPQ